MSSLISPDASTNLFTCPGSFSRTLIFGFWCSHVRRVRLGDNTNKGDKANKETQTKQTQLFVLCTFACLFCLLLFVLFTFPRLFCLLFLVCFVYFSLFSSSRHGLAAISPMAFVSLWYRCNLPDDMLVPLACSRPQLIPCPPPPRALRLDSTLMPLWYACCLFCLLILVCFVYFSLFVLSPFVCFVDFSLLVLSTSQLLFVLILFVCFVFASVREAISFTSHETFSI